MGLDRRRPNQPASHPHTPTVRNASSRAAVDKLNTAAAPVCSVFNFPSTKRVQSTLRAKTNTLGKDIESAALHRAPFHSPRRPSLVFLPRKSNIYATHSCLPWLAPFVRAPRCLLGRRANLPKARPHVSRLPLFFLSLSFPGIAHSMSRISMARVVGLLCAKNTWRDQSMCLRARGEGDAWVDAVADDVVSLDP